ncbi:hypothetical protein Bhyg_08132 [Pseudolycoriella hygida]|uniref:Thyroglobulin type-1 domain-containing protein n=1 Tax=Pseudolycoriella hygida TaxID=35572 RepID=A0A9Q0N5B0_9DIPT|nr:hypothetical protein Bhyg_08132 [Pseudolycoriella hygida]
MITNENINLVNRNMYLGKVSLGLAAAVVFVSILRVNGDCTQIQCSSSLTQHDCSARGEYLELNITNSCCPVCRRGLGWGDSNCSETNACSPGLECRSGTCILDKNTCSYTYHLREEVQALPQCHLDGNFAAKQCKKDRFLGSRQRYKLESEGKITTLHCKRNGNYEPLQCDSGICWCAEETTGRVMNGTRAVPEIMWTQLPCYNAAEFGSQYLRQCDSISNAQNLLLWNFALHGTLDVSIVKTQCDFDGTYGTYSINKDMATCMWRDGSRIGIYAIQSNLVSQMNCNCARDELYFEESPYKTTLICDGYGNYKPIQSINEHVFCVDSDGFNVTERKSEIDSCSQFLYKEINPVYGY